MIALPLWLGLTIFASFGLIVGSFLNVCIYRLPRNASIAWPASRCPACKRTLAWYENIPVFSYAALGGRCRTCRASIGIRYPVIEALTGAAFVLCYLVFGFTLLGFVRIGFSCVLIVLFAIDLEHQILPNIITLPGIVAGLVASVFVPPGLLMALAGAAAGGATLWLIIELWLRLRGVEAMGFGDVKMLAMVGAFLGLKLVILTFVLSSIIGGIIGAALMATRRAGLSTALPYGTMIAVAAFVASLEGDRLVAWYLSLYR
ncbi:MAG TPA: prepilin peptidase [Vicinamibacterales bacterium]|jgi:leader peptidase (prepilin peptidase)/N-methyltransferase